MRYRALKTALAAGLIMASSIAVPVVAVQKLFVDTGLAVSSKQL